MWDWGCNYDKSMTVKEQLTVPALYQPLPAPSADSWLLVLIHMSDLCMKRGGDDLKSRRNTSTRCDVMWQCEVFSWTKGQNWKLRVEWKLSSIKLLMYHWRKEVFVCIIWCIWRFSHHLTPTTDCGLFLVLLFPSLQFHTGHEPFLLYVM